MKNRAFTSYQPPVTYAALIQEIRADFDRRLAELKRAEKYIRAIETDMRILRDQHGLNFSRTGYSFVLTDRSNGTSLRRQYVLRLNTGVFSETRDKYVTTLIGMGWLFDREGSTGRYGSAILRKPKTQIRIELEASSELREQLTAQAAGRAITAKEDTPCSAS